MSLSNYLGLAAMAGSALFLAFDEKRRVARVLGRSWLVLVGFSVGLLGLVQGKAVDLVFGAALLGAAGVSWRSMRQSTNRRPAHQPVANDE